MKVVDYNITELIPQRAPFIMVGSVISNSSSSIVTEFTADSDNIFSEDGEFIEAGLIENIAQSAAAMEGCIAKENNQTVRLGFIGSVKSLKIYRNAQIGEKLITSVEVINQVIGVNIIKGEVRSNDELLAECEMNIFLQE